MKQINKFINEKLEAEDKKVIDKCIDQFNAILNEDPNSIDEFLYYFLDKLTDGDEIIMDHIESWLKETKNK